MNEEKMKLLTSNNPESLPKEISPMKIIPPITNKSSELSKEIYQSKMNSPQDPTISKPKFPSRVNQVSQKVNPPQVQNTKKSHPRDKQTLVKQNLQEYTTQKETLVNEIQTPINKNMNSQGITIPKESVKLKESSPPRRKNSKLKCANHYESSWQKEPRSQVNPKPSGPSSSTLFGQFWSKLWGGPKTSSYLLLPSSPSSEASKKPQEKTASVSMLLNSPSTTDLTFSKSASVKETNPTLSKNLT